MSEGPALDGLSGLSGCSVQGDLYCWSMRFTLALTLLAALGGCSAQGDLPPLRASSPHIKYFARADTAVQTDVVERLERFRVDVYAFLNLHDDSGVNYYLFDNLDDLTRNSPCGRPQDCTVGRDIFSSLCVRVSNK
jgi:hypothetical protein